MNLQDLPRIAKITEKNSVRPPLGGVLIDNVKMCATDSFKLIQVKHEKPLKEFTEPIVLHAEDIKKVKVGKKTKSLTVEREDNHALVKTEEADGTITEKRVSVINEDYPAVEQITGIMEEEAKNEIVVNATYLIELLKCYDKDQHVTLKFHDKNTPLVIEDKKQVKQCLLMPIRS